MTYPSAARVGIEAPDVFAALADRFVSLDRAMPPPAVGGEIDGLFFGGLGTVIAGFNRLMPVSMTPETADEAIDAGLAALSSFNALSAWLAEGVGPADLAARFRARGFVDDEDDPDGVPAMAMRLDASIEPEAVIAPQGDGRLTIVEVETREQLRAADAVLAAAFGVPDDVAAELDERLAPLVGVASAAARVLLLLDGDVPVATALTTRGSDVVAIYNVGTLPAVRGRGYGSLVTRVALDRSIAEGARLAVLESSAEGYGIYRRLGFVEVGRYRVLVRERR